MKIMLKIASMISIAVSCIIFILSIAMLIKGQKMIDILVKNSSDFKEMISQFSSMSSGTLALILAISVFVCGILYLLPGIFGLKGINGSNKLLIAGLVIMAILCVSSFVSFSIFGLALTVLYFVSGVGTYLENKNSQKDKRHLG